MRYEKRIDELMAMHKRLLEKLAKRDLSTLPKDIDLKKLEKAYDALKGYEFVLKKIAKT